MNVRILALCAGYGGLEMAVTAGIGGSVVAFAENDPHAAAVFSSHHPGVPNLGDITEADWTAVRDQFSPTVIAAGFPCRNISNAGDRTGIEGEFSRVWKNVAEAVGVVRPRYVFLENVAAILRRGIDTVAGDLAGIGYDARWTCLRASEPEIGSYHPRNRWFCLAYPTAQDPDSSAWNERRSAAPGQAEGRGHGSTLEDETVFLFAHTDSVRRDRGPGDQSESYRGAEPEDGRDQASLPTPTARDWKSGASNLIGTNARPLNEVVVNTLPTPKASDGPHGGPNQRDTAGNYYLPALAVQPDSQWLASTGKDYGPAVRRWETVLGRTAPRPTEPGTRSNRRLSPAFTEWMMGLPAGWTTDVPDVPRKEQIRMLGNGVVWQQAHEGYSRLFAIDTSGMDDMSTETEQKTDKPRGTCAGCGFEYTLSLARSGEFKGEPVTRKHNSRVGPGLCDGAQKPPKSEELEEESSAVEELRATGAFDEPQLPHDTGAACTHPHGFPYADDGNGHSGSFCPDCCFPEPDQFAAPKPAELPLTSPKRPAFFAQFDSDGSCGHDIAEGDLIQSDGNGDFLCADCTELGPSPDRPQHTYDDGNGGIWVHEGLAGSCPLPECAEIEQQRVNAAAAGINSVMTIADPSPMANAAFVDPAPMPAELPPVSGQPEPDRDRWGRYLIAGQGHTRATSFAKLGSSTFALSEWGERMLIKGLTERPDLLALAHGLDVKRDKKALNGIADDAQTHAGNKVAANIGTAYHAFTERLDAGLITLSDVPEQYRARCEQYVNTIRVHGLTTRAEWIERTTAVRADQVLAPVPVAGTLDRIWQLPNGELVIGDLKTGSDLSYGWAEIAVQLAVYAHGVNTFGLFDWNSKTWQPPQHALSTPGVDFRTHVRTDYAIVMHLPADGDGCTLYRVDLVKGWKYAQVSGEVQTRQKDKSLAGVLVLGSLATDPQPAAESMMERASRLIDSAVHADELITLLKHAGESGKFTDTQFEELKGLCGLRWQALQA